MLTPSEIRNRRFEKGMSGYRTEEVNSFLEEMATQVEQHLEEQVDLERKLEILAEKVEQYREDEDSLRAALIGAQKLGDSVVRDAKRKAEAIIAQATRKAEDLLAETQNSINKEAMALTKMQMEVAKFKSQVLALYRQHIELIQEIPYDEKVVAENTEAAPFVANIGETVEVSTQESIPDDEVSPEEKELQLSFDGVEDDDGEDEEVTIAFESIVEAGGPGAEPSDVDDDDEEFPRRNKSKFGPLRFGEAYDLTRKD